MAAVRSALGQEGALVEVCVVDDGSEPPVELPADLAADERVTLIRFETTRGPAAARNAGLAATGAELVAFLDDDDAWLPGKLTRQVNALIAAGDAAVLVVADLGAIATVPEVLVDRRWSPLSPSLARTARAQISPRLEQRLDRLPAKEAARLRARLHTDDAVILARLGDRRGAARLLLRCLRAHPRSRAAARGLARALAGERIWSVAARVATPARARFRRRPPRPPGPAPQWAGP